METPVETDRAAGRSRPAAPASFVGICAGCRYCGYCPEGFPIPKPMDAYNRKLLYGDDSRLLGQLRHQWDVGRNEAALSTCLSSSGSKIS